MTMTFKVIAQVALLWLIYWSCNWFVTWSGLPVPANVLGIVILFSLLFFGVIKEEHISDAASFLLKHLVFFFVPVAVGLMQWGEVFYNYGLVLLVAIVTSAIIPFCSVGLLAQFLQNRQNRCNK